MRPCIVSSLLLFLQLYWGTLSIKVYPKLDGSPHIMYRIGKPVYVILNDTSRHMIPDRYTMNVLGHWAHHQIKQMDRTMQERYPKGDHIDTLWNTHPNNAILSLLNHRPRLVQQTYHVFTRLLNPSVIWRHGEIFISGRWASDEKYQNMFWLNQAMTHSVIPRQSFEKTLQSLTHVVFNTSVVPHGKVFGEDPRLFVMSNGRMFVVICHRFLRMKPELQMAYAELLPHDNRIEVGPLIDIKFTDYPKDDQKNWSPFEYNHSMLFIQSIQPHRIVRTSFVPPLIHNTDKDFIAAGSRLTAFKGPVWSKSYIETWPGEDTTASKALSTVVQGTTVGLTTIKPGSFRWAWGDLRGGTPALYVGGNRYLTFFHSSNEPPATGDVLRTYVFGAYTFEAQPPFAIKAISDAPIVHETMYSGPWANLPRSFYHIDYVAFPMSFVVENGSVILLYGKQDCDAWVAKIDLQGLLQSLVSVETNVEINSYYGTGKGLHGGQGLDQETEGERQGFGREKGHRKVQPSASAGTGALGITSTSTSTGGGVHSGTRRLSKRHKPSAV